MSWPLSPTIQPKPVLRMDTSQSRLSFSGAFSTTLVSINHFTVSFASVSSLAWLLRVGACSTQSRDPFRTHFPRQSHPEQCVNHYANTSDFQEIFASSLSPLGCLTDLIHGFILSSIYCVSGTTLGTWWRTEQAWFMPLSSLTSQLSSRSSPNQHAPSCFLSQ